MSEILSANYTKESTHKCMRKVMIDGNDNNLVDELVREDLSDSEYSNDQRHERCESKNGVCRPRHCLTTFSLRSVIDGEVQSKFNITCLICKRKFACNDARSTFLAYYICDDCMKSEKGHAEELEAALLNNDKARPVSTGCASADLSAYDHCKCQNCIRRQFVDEERRKEIEVLQRCWHDLRQNIRQMFRDGLNANMTSSKGKRFDVDKIKRNVTILAEKDPHQLYKRLESIGHEYVLNLKSDDLWQILVAPQVVPALIQLYEAGASEEQMELERAKLFIKTLLDRFSCQQETARNMSPLLAVLDEDYLSQFGISWKVVNHHIFDRVIYQDDLLLNYLPNLENILKCKLIVHDDENEEDFRQRACTEASRADIPQGALELAQSFRVFHKLMVTSREIFKKASANIVLYTEQQKVINHIKRKAKGELLKEDLEFFKNQRKMIRNSVLRKGQYYQWHANLTAFGDLTDLIDDECDNSGSETDDVNVSERLHELIGEGPATSVCIDENDEVLPCVRCKRCTLRHCSCDECRISHIITCGLLIESDDISNLIWPVSQPVSDCSEKSDGRDSDSEQSEQKKSSLPHVKRLPSRNLRFQTAKALFTVHDHHSKKETAWGDWQVPYGYTDDIDYLSHRFYEKKGMRNGFGSLNNRTDEEEHATDSSDSPDLLNTEKYQEIVKEALELMARGHRIGSSPNCEFETDDISRTSSVIGDEKTSIIDEGDDKRGVKSSFLMKANLRSEGKSGFTIASVSNVNVKRFKIKKARSNPTGDSDGTESDYETSSASFPGSNECMDSCHLLGPDRLLLKEMTRRHYAVLSKDNAVSDLALELFGRKTMGKPQMMRKTGLTPPVSRLIRKSKLVSDKNDANNGGISAVKSLSASARERLLNEVKGMDKKVRERTLLRLVQSYEDEHWITKSSEDYKGRLLESMRECLSKDWMKEDEAIDLRTIVKDENYDSARKILSRNSTVRTCHQEKTNREMIYIPETRTMVSFSTASSDSVNKKGKSSKKIEQDDLAQLWSKQTLAAAIAKQLTEQRTIFDISKAFNVEKQKAAQTLPSKTGKHLDTTSNSTAAIDFSVDLGEFDINTFPEEVRKLHEEGKLKKLLKQAVGLRQNKTGVSAKVDCKYDDGKRVENEFRVSKEEFFGCQTDNIDDLTDDDDEGTDEEWSDCEAPDKQHPHRHHSCDNKAKNKRAASGTGRDGRHGHCDCCYCEMFGHAATENVKSGRAQIRERLRMKLKRRTVQEHPGTDTKNLEEKLVYATANEKSKKSSAVIPDTPIEEILDYINEKDIAAAQAAASKAAKRARQKLRKQEEKERQGRERKLKEEQKKVIEAELLKKKKQDVAQQEVKKEKQNKPEAKKKKADRVRGKKQKDAHDRKKENGQQSESQGVELRKEPVLEFEYWIDPKCGPKLKQLGSTKEQIGTSKIGRSKTQNKEELKKNDVPKRSELEEKRENEKENSCAKEQTVEANLVVKKDNNGSKNENSAVKSETTFSVNCAAMFLKTEDHESKGVGFDIQPAVKLPLDEESDAPSAAVTVNEASTVLSEVELRSHPPSVSYPITERPSKMPPLPKINLSDIPQMRPGGLSNTNISQKLPFPVLPVPPPSQTNTLSFGTYQGGVGYYTNFGGQPQVYLINGLNQCVVSSSNQSVSILSAASANFAHDPVLQPLRTHPSLEARTCQIAINDKAHISGQYPIPPPVNAPLTDMLQRGPISSIPVLDAKSFQTATNFSCFGFQKLPRYASETSSLSTLASSVSSSSSKPSLSGPPFSVRDMDVSFKGNHNTTQMPSLGAMNMPLQNNLCNNNGTAQNFLSTKTNTATQGFTLLDSYSCPKHRSSNVAIPLNNVISDSLSVPTRDLLNFPSLEQDIVATKIQKSPQYINTEFLVSHRNGIMSTTGSVNNTAQSNKIGTGGALPGSSQLTAAVRAKRNEACKTFLSSSSPLADYDSETRKLAAFAKEGEIPHNQNPMIFEPGDPRIAVAIAEMKFDPHEAFKPRPDSELEFLDPLELEVEHFKRVLWEEEQLTRPRVPLRELRKIDPENEPNAVFHFAPLV
ncbi:hypothetical protein LOAG_16904 [Loa loa]|uniref:ATP-dependent DNA helicase n=1 Tax=Loa loa TaxID=7209 RepID=A0A1I7V9E2_LOALO|nr:hypothetical protein LOAG_16904 [Loa loa]EJD76071.1 hypothetical protein LOAG_16904 [Loa loa]